MLSHAGTQACNSDSESDQAQFAALLAATHRPPNTLNKIVMGSSVVSRLNLSSAMALCQPGTPVTLATAGPPVKLTGLAPAGPINLKLTRWHPSQPKPQTDIGFHRDGLCHSHSDSKIRP